MNLDYVIWERFCKLWLLNYWRIVILPENWSCLSLLYLYACVKKREAHFFPIVCHIYVARLWYTAINFACSSYKRCFSELFYLFPFNIFLLRNSSVLPLCSLNWQHQLCKNPRANPDIKTLFTDHTCSPPNGPLAPTPVNLPVAAVAKPASYASLGTHSVWCSHLVFLKKMLTRLRI